MAVGGYNPFPSLETIANLFRLQINDTFNNAGGSGVGYGGGAGLIMPDSSPDILTLMNSAIRELYSDLRNIGDPELIIDNYLLTGIPPLANSAPAVQVSLGFSGYFNGVTMSNTWTLPIGLVKPLALWERWTNSGENFIPMAPAPFGIGGGLQGTRMGQWEWRQNQIWMPGCLDFVDLRLRGRITYPDNLGPNLNFSTTYVPILTCENAVVAKMMILYAKRFAPEQYQMAIADEVRLTDKLRLEVVRQMQAQENQRAEFGTEAVQDFAVSWSWL